ncbi:MAG: alkaline shock response membrane anchor protein AmaP [Candidatus Omnitrophica bacterium]|nr:alkaline shock response membrane anchor protein AmaP [Candidatus Omnitrophota bacterium]
MRVITFAYMAIFIALGAWMAAFAGHLVPVDTVAIFFQTIYDDQHLRVLCGILGAAVIIFNVMVFQLLWARFQRQRTIAFTNPDGPVTISLGAVEDFIRRAARQVSEIKEARADVLATKKGIEVTARVSLWSEAHIPEVTEKIQGLVKAKVQEMLGIEDPVWVRVHVAKIAAREEPASPPRGPADKAAAPPADAAAEWDAPRAPFRGFDYGVREEE